MDRPLPTLKLVRTPKGRVATALAYAHFGRRADAPAPAAAQQKLF